MNALLASVMLISSMESLGFQKLCVQQMEITEPDYNGSAVTGTYTSSHCVKWLWVKPSTGEVIRNEDMPLYLELMKEWQPEIAI